MFIFRLFLVYYLIIIIINMSYVNSFPSLLYVLCLLVSESPFGVRSSLPFCGTQVRMVQVGGCPDTLSRWLISIVCIVIVLFYMLIVEKKGKRGVVWGILPHHTFIPFIHSYHSYFTHSIHFQLLYSMYSFPFIVFYVTGESHQWIVPFVPKI